MAEKLQPLADKVIIRPIEQETISKSGIIIPDTAKEKSQEGEVVSVGPGKINDDGTRIAMSVKTGDRVIYAKYGGSEVKLGDEKLLIVSESDIIAKKLGKA